MVGVKFGVAVVLVLLGADAGRCEVLKVRVERVLDGDTFHGKVVAGAVPAGVKHVRDSLVSVRLDGIDAPEKDQPWGDSSRHALGRRVAGSVVAVEIVDIDRYRRVVGRVHRDGIDVNRSLVASGDAWMYRRFSSSRDLDSLESAARLGRLGLWKTQAPVPPWDWRRERRRRR